MELAKLLPINKSQAAKAVFDNALRRGAGNNINLLKSYTSLLFNAKDLQNGAKMLRSYRALWNQQKKSALLLQPPLTVAEQQQLKQPYGHGIGIAYYHTVLDQDQIAEQTLKGLIKYDPDQYGADNELAGLQKRLGRNDDARKTLANAYARGGDKNTSTVVSYAGILRLFGETSEALAVLQNMKPADLRARATCST